MHGVPPRASRLSPLTRRRLANFRKNRRGFWSMWVFLAIFVLTLFAEFTWVLPVLHLGIVGMLILTRWWDFWTS